MRVDFSMEGTCSNVNLNSNHLYGRYLVAARDFQQGEVILKEKCLVIGPKIRGDLICLNCYGVFNKRFHVCSQCKLAPLCAPICEDHRGGHTESECKTFAQFRGKVTVPQLLNCYHLVTILRCLALQGLEEPTGWNALMNLESHIDKRKGTSLWDFHESSKKVLHQLGVIDEGNLIQKICAIMDVNSFELRTPLNGSRQPNTNSLCGIYSTAAMMAHSCVGNTHLSIDDSYVMTVRAAVPIQKGQTIFFNYTNSLNGSVERREHLREGKYFECVCERCADGTELNTHMSSIKCQACSGGLVTMADPKSASQYSQRDTWKCGTCTTEYTGCDIKQILDTIANRIPEDGDEDISHYQEFLCEAAKYLPPTHNVMIDVKHKLAGLLRDVMQMTLPSREMLQDKLAICKELLPLLEVIEPGISRLKAITLYEIYNPLITMSNMDFDSKEISSSVFLERLKEAEHYLKESIKYLILEPLNSPEATLCRRAMMELRNLKSNMDSVRVLVQEDT